MRSVLGIDAVVCAWVGICALEGRAHPFGDQNSAIWIPTLARSDGFNEKSPASEEIPKPAIQFKTWWTV